MFILIFKVSFLNYKATHTSEPGGPPDPDQSVLSLIALCGVLAKVNHPPEGEKQESSTILRTAQSCSLSYIQALSWTTNFSYITLQSEARPWVGNAGPPGDWIVVMLGHKHNLLNFGLFFLRPLAKHSCVRGH